MFEGILGDSISVLGWILDVTDNGDNEGVSSDVDLDPDYEAGGLGGFFQLASYTVDKHGLARAVQRFQMKDYPKLVLLKNPEERIHVFKGDLADPESVQSWLESRGAVEK